VVATVKQLWSKSLGCFSRFPQISWQLVILGGRNLWDGHAIKKSRNCAAETLKYSILQWWLTIAKVTPALARSRLCLQSMGAEAHINACYKHFFYFVRNFNLVDKRELEPLVSEWVAQERRSCFSQIQCFSTFFVPNPINAFRKTTVYCFFHSEKLRFTSISEKLRCSAWPTWQCNNFS